MYCHAGDPLAVGHQLLGELLLHQVVHSHITLGLQMVEYRHFIHLNFFRLSRSNDLEMVRSIFPTFFFPSLLNGSVGFHKEIDSDRGMEDQKMIHGYI